MSATAQNLEAGKRTHLVLGRCVLLPWVFCSLIQPIKLLDSVDWQDLKEHFCVLILRVGDGGNFYVGHDKEILPSLDH